uniref:Uncharacterized protein n=1 Tax=Candidozyma auris TaxID=498019 RepID=A0A0L0NVD5_CANAR
MCPLAWLMDLITIGRSDFAADTCQGAQSMVHNERRDAVRKTLKRSENEVTYLFGESLNLPMPNSSLNYPESFHSTQKPVCSDLGRAWVRQFCVKVK